MFIGRGRELGKLNGLYHEDGFQLPVIYGRRRVAGGEATLARAAGLASRGCGRHASPATNGVPASPAANDMPAPPAATHNKTRSNACTGAGPR